MLESNEISSILGIINSHGGEQYLSFFFFFFVWRQRRTREYLFLDSSSRKHNWLMRSEFPAQSGLPDQFLLCEERSLSEEQQGTGGKC